MKTLDERIAFVKREMVDHAQCFAFPATLTLGGASLTNSAPISNGCNLLGRMCHRLPNDKSCDVPPPRLYRAS